MKGIYVFFTRFIISVKNNKSMYITLLTVLSITFVGLMHQYTAQRENIRERKVEEEDNYQIKVDISKIAKEQIKKIWNEDSFQLQNIIFNAKIENDDLPTGMRHRHILYAEYRPDYSNNYYGDKIEERNISNADKVIIVPSIYRLKNKGSNYVKINEVKYKIIGEQQLQDNRYIIPYTTLLSSGGLQQIVISVKPTEDSKIFNKIKSYIQTEWNISDDEIELPEINSATRTRTAQSMIDLIITTFFAFLNCSFIYIYFLDRRRKEFAIMRIEGATKLRAFLSYIVEMVIVSTSSYILSIGIFATINEVIFGRVFQTITVHTVVADLVSLYLITLIILVLMVSIITVRFTIHFPREELSGGEEY